MYRIRIFSVVIMMLCLGLSAALALDGYVLMTKVGSNEYGTGSLYLKDISTGSYTLLVSGSVFSNCFSPDGQCVAFIKDGNIYTMPSTGGAATLIYSGAPSSYLEPGLSWDENDNLWWSSSSVYDRVYYVKAQAGASLQEKTFTKLQCNGASGCKGVISLQVCKDGTKGASWARPYIAAQGGADGTTVTFNFTNGTTKLYNPMCMGAISPSGNYFSVNHEDHASGSIKYFSSGSNYKSITVAPTGYRWTGFRWSRHSEYHLMYVTESPSVKTYILDIRDNSKIHLGDGYRAWDYYNGVLGSGNRPPSVAITSPSDGYVTGGDSTISVTANATDTDGSVASVEFFAGSVSLGTDASSPFSASWTPTVGGSYQLTAVATDDSGATSTSMAVTVTVRKRSPYGGTAWSIPGKIECEDFDEGGEGLAYHDETPGNRDGNYRTDVDVDIGAGGGSSGYFVTSTDVSEWLTWSVDVQQSADYTLRVRVANGSSAGQFHLEVDGVTVAGEYSGQTTGSYSTWQDFINTDITLAVGSHILKLEVDGFGYIFDYIEFEQASAPADLPPSVSLTAPSDGSETPVDSAVTITADASDDNAVASVEFFIGSTSLGTDAAAPYSVVWTPTVTDTYLLTAVATDDSGQTTTSSAITVMVIEPAVPDERAPYGGTAWGIPGKIQCEDFDEGGEGVAYHDLTSGNRDGDYRTDVDVDIKAGGGSEGYYVTSTETGEWLTWSVNVAKAGWYTVAVQAANGTDAGTFHLELDDSTVVCLCSPQSTGSYGTWQEFINTDIWIEAGSHVLKLEIDDMGYIFDYISFSTAVPVTLASFTAEVASGSVTLAWTTASETDNLGFNVLKSAEEDGMYEKINQSLIPGAGTSAEVNSYSYTDGDAAPGTSFYMLEQVDTNGTRTLSDPLEVTVQTTALDDAGYDRPDRLIGVQNPAGFGNMVISFSEAIQAKISVYGPDGAFYGVMADRQFPAGTSNLAWPAAAQGGLYIIIIDAGYRFIVEKVIINR